MLCNRNNCNILISPVLLEKHSLKTITLSYRYSFSTRLRKEKSLIPAHLIQSSASDIDYQIRGNLEYSENSSNKFKHTRWVVLKDSVLYIFKKREDAAAIQTVPILGYLVGLFISAEYLFM